MTPRPESGSRVWNGATLRLDIALPTSGMQIATSSVMLCRQYRREILIAVTSSIALPASTSPVV